MEDYELCTYPLYRADAAYDSDKRSLRHNIWVSREIGYKAGIAVRNGDRQEHTHRTHIIVNTNSLQLLFHKLLIYNYDMHSFV